jgi:hypothetical protein
MGQVRELADRVCLRYRSAGGLTLFETAEAYRFLDACLAEGKIVLGIEGFYIDGKQVVPEMGAIADFSDVSSSGESIMEGRAFLGKVGALGLLFEFTLD